MREQEKKAKRADVENDTIPVCDGNTIDSGLTTIYFTNSNNQQAFTINRPTAISGGQPMPGWPATNPQVPKAQNGQNGSTTVVLSVATQSGAEYQYTTTPTCPSQANPKIIVSN